MYSTIRDTPDILSNFYITDKPLCSMFVFIDLLNFIIF